MTGVLNRRGGLSYLQKVLINQRKANNQLIVGYFDINRLKQVNDTMGHEIGNQLICHVVDHLRKHIDPVNRMIRMGGDDKKSLVVGIFVLLLTGSNNMQNFATICIIYTYIYKM